MCFMVKVFHNAFVANCFIALNIVYFLNVFHMCFNLMDKQEVRSSISEQINTNVRQFSSLPRKGSRPRWIPSRLLLDVPLNVGIGWCTNFCSLSLFQVLILLRCLSESFTRMVGMKPALGVYLWVPLPVLRHVERFTGYRLIEHGRFCFESNDFYR